MVALRQIANQAPTKRHNKNSFFDILCFPLVNEMALIGLFRFNSSKFGVDDRRCNHLCGEDAVYTGLHNSVSG
jgi:hypothetical protein